MGGRMFQPEETADAKAQRYVEQGVADKSDVAIQQLFLALIPGSDGRTVVPSILRAICGH